MNRNSLIGLLVYTMVLSPAIMLLGCKVAIEHVPDQSTPESTVLEYYHALAKADLHVVENVFDGQSIKASKILTGYKGAIKSGVRFEISNLEVVTWKNTGEVAQVGTRYHEKILQSDKVITEGQSGSLLGLVKINGKWYISTFDGD